MIKINLLPPLQQKQAKAVASGGTDFLLLIFFTVALLLAVAGAHYYYTDQEDTLKSELVGKEKIKTELQRQVAEVSGLLKELEDVERKIKVIKDVRLRQGLPVKYIDEIVTRMPKEKIWIESLSLNSDANQISMSGVMLDNQSFARFVDSLRESKYIALVDTKQTSLRSVDGLDLISFQCAIVAREFFENIDTNGTENGN